ncbi:helix-turn-helix domain-containing protein [Leptolyngbya sp. AN03gr2]|uniref:helix-turn-helix domain-containing protein n=1 Tax=unclassified Leptolyngbya TaxID=2650499 RepID=UPI003D31A847
MLQENDRSGRLARLVKRLRGDASTYVFGAQLGVTHSTIRRWESGQGGINEEAIEKLSDGTGIPPDTIRAYLRGNLSLRVCLGLEEATQSEAQTVFEQLPMLTVQELLTVLEAVIAQLLKRLPNVRPEVTQILQAAINLLGVPRSSNRSPATKASKSAAERFLPRTIQDAIVDEIEARYGSVNSRTIAQFAEEVEIQPSDRLVQLIQGEKTENVDLTKLQPYLQKYSNQRWSVEELLQLAYSKHQE